MGAYTITERLNERHVPTFDGGQRRNAGYISRIVTNHSVIGEFQPCRIVSGHKRVPDGDHIPNYFPPITPAELFAKVQADRKHHRQKLESVRARQVNWHLPKVGKFAHSSCATMVARLAGREHYLAFQVLR